MIKLSKRLEAISSLVPNNSKIIDIGCDHGLLDIYLYQQKKCNKIIASDINESALNNAKKNIKKNNLETKIETRLGGGLSVLEEGEADTVIIAGMGGELICQIIKDDIKKAKKSVLIIQPMNAQYEVRKFLFENGFKIKCEDIECEAHRVYNIIIAENGKQEPFEKDIYYHIPFYLKENRNFIHLYNKKKNEFLKIIKGIEGSNKCDEEKLNYYRKCLEDLENDFS